MNIEVMMKISNNQFSLLHTKLTETHTCMRAHTHIHTYTHTHTHTHTYAHSCAIVINLEYYQTATNRWKRSPRRQWHIWARCVSLTPFFCCRTSETGKQDLSLLSDLAWIGWQIPGRGATGARPSKFWSNVFFL